jgi:hypothetical protein
MAQSASGRRVMGALSVLSSLRDMKTRSRVWLGVMMGNSLHHAAVTRPSGSERLILRMMMTIFHVLALPADTLKMSSLSNGIPKRTFSFLQAMTTPSNVGSMKTQLTISYAPLPLKGMNQ